MVELKELKGGSIRCIIPYKDNEGNKHEIEVYNIIGDRRKQILEEITELIGGTKDASGKIVVGETPDDMYSFEGTFYLTTDDGQRLVKKATIKKCKPQISDSVSLSALDLSTFSLTFDILKDDEIGRAHV